MARAALRLTVTDLADRAEVAPNTIVRFETEIMKPRRSTIALLRRVLEEQGIEFDDASNGVRLRPRS